MSTATIKVYNIFKNKFSDEEAQEIVSYLESIPKEGLATKEDIHEVKAEISKLEVRLIKWIVGTAIGAVSAIVGILQLLK